jgi:hypothetical protein
MSVSTRPPRSRPRALLAGGTDGNERLTGLTGLLLIVLLAVLGVTIIRIGQLLWLHLFLGLLLLGPLALKLMSTGYRFVRYYTDNAAYREKGPPHPALRGLAPVVVALTLAVFVTGILLLALGPSSRDPLVLLHKVTFIAWIAFTALHVLGHVPEILKLRPAAERAMPGSGAGEAGRWLSLSSALVLGLVVAVVLIPEFSAWTHGSFHHH